MNRKIILIITIMIITILIVLTSNMSICARAGGGGGTSGGSSGGSSGSSSHYHNSSSNSKPSLLRTVISYLNLMILLGISSIILKFKVFKAKINSKKIMKMLGNKEDSWKYKNIQKQVEKGFYEIQKAWTSGSMIKAEKYMSKTLYDQFEIKLQWMNIRKEKNVLEKIKLIEATPVSVYDNEDDSKDLVWYFISAKMIDYIINEENGEIKEGSTTEKNKFIEYWKFVREDNRWVLDKILQKDEFKI